MGERLPYKQEVTGSNPVPPIVGIAATAPFLYPLLTARIPWPLAWTPTRTPRAARSPKVAPKGMRSNISGPLPITR